MLKGAGEKLKEELGKIGLSSPEIPFVSNVTAEEVEQPEELKNLLARQVYSPVKWQQSIERMIQEGTDTFVEIGPGTTLSKFVKKIDRHVKVYHVETVEDLETLKKAVSAAPMEQAAG